jgi:hypothetical protein
MRRHTAKGHGKRSCQVACSDGGRPRPLPLLDHRSSTLSSSGGPLSQRSTQQSLGGRARCAAAALRHPHVKEKKPRQHRKPARKELKGNEPTSSMYANCRRGRKWPGWGGARSWGLGCPMAGSCSTPARTAAPAGTDPYLNTGRQQCMDQEHINDLQGGRAGQLLHCPLKAGIAECMRRHIRGRTRAASRHPSP